ncbi:MAG: hypothetical protein E6R13_07370 [Spirochaetes bacterium]|nr:MAG: hypothetical protein E6R13_07370 [Spirochaetota bacterium]
MNLHIRCMEINFEIFEFDRNKDELSEKEIQYLDTLDVKTVQAIIDHCTNKYNYYNAIQTGLKLILNSIYGAFGNEYFVCSTKDIAGAITAMGRDVVKYMDNINETYWYEYWHEDYELHEHLGITGDVKPIDSSWIHRLSKTDHEGEVSQTEMEDGEYQRKVPVSNYVDTDSLFVGFNPAMQSCDWQGDEQEFVWKVSKFRLEKLFKTKLKNYAKKYHVENIQDFELENINESILFVTKKKYIKHTIWEDGRQYDRLANIVPKGVDLIKKGTPKFAREKVMDIINYLFDNPKTYNIKDLLKFVRDLKKEFEMTNINDICPGANINAYWSSKIMVDGQIIDAPGIVEDKETLKVAKGTYYTVKAAGLYNHLLYQHPELVNTYQIIKPGVKVKIYPCIHDLNDKFCYILGSFTPEFAPPVDYDELFQKTVAEQVNYYLEALELPKLNKRLKIIVSLF